MQPMKCGVVADKLRAAAWSWGNAVTCHGARRYMHIKTLALSLYALAIASSAHAGVPSLEAHEIGTGDARISNWETDWGSYDRDFSRSKKIAVTLRNMSRKPVPFAVTVYFIAKPTVAINQIGYDARQLFIYDRREHAGEFHNEIELIGAFASRNLKSNVQHYEPLGVDSASGNDMIGWVVLGYSNGDLFGVAASSQELLQLAQGQSHLSFQKMIADYERNHPSTLAAANATLASADSQSATPQPAAQVAVRQAPQRIADEFITLTRPVDVRVAYGNVKLPAGTRLKVASRAGTTINVVYVNDTVTIPAGAAK